MFITFEGIEGCGKTTQVERLDRLLEERRIPHLVTREPGGTRLGGYIRGILLDRDHGEMEGLTELLLYGADRAQHVAEVIRPALAAGRWIVCDRFADATAAYQGYGRGQDLDLIRRLNLAATQGVWPDLTVLLDCPVEVGLERARRRVLAGDSPAREDGSSARSSPFTCGCVKGTGGSLRSIQSASGSWTPPWIRTGSMR